jgi:CDP-diacylglycerol--serine O-phosphatidyltransferase
MTSYKLIPNTLTSCNLFAGCAGLAFLQQGQLYLATMFVFIAALFDFLDGTAARLLNARSELGKQLDSLADVVSFGVLPGLIMFRLLEHAVEFQYPETFWMRFLPYLALLIPVASAIRLGRFNIDIRQTEHFIGLPTPANALFIAGFPLALSSEGFLLKITIINIINIIYDPFFLSVICLLSTIMLNAEVPLFSMKFKNLRWKENDYKYLLLMISIILFVIFNYTALLMIVPLYVIFSLLYRRKFWT